MKTENSLKYLCLDVGDKFIGVAISHQILVTPLPVILRQGKFQFKKIIRLVEEYSVDKIIVGYPKYLDGSISVQSKKVKNYFKKLKSLVTVPVILFDETLSTWEVKQKYPNLKKSNLKISNINNIEKQIKNIDSFCAMEILKNFLEVKL